MEVMLRLSRYLALFGVLCTLLLAPAISSAQPTKEQITKARGHYNQGIELYEEGDFDAALVEFQRAYEVAPAYKILYNIGLVQRQLNDHAGALRAFKQFLDEGGKKIDTKRRAEVEREIAKLQGRVAKLSLKSNVDGATILVDDAERGETPLSEPLLVNAGRRKISLNKSGYISVTRIVKLAGGDEQELEIELKPGEGSSASTPPSSPQQPSDEPGQKPPDTDPDQQPAAEGSSFPWLPWAITGVLAAGTTVAAVMTMSAESDLESEREGVTSRQKLDDAESKTRTLALVTDVLLAATVISAGVSLYITLGSDDDDPKTEQAAARPLQIGIGPGSVNLRGSF